MLHIGMIIVIMTIINKVADIRKKEQETQAELAEAIGVSRQTIIAIEKGNYTPSLALALKIAHHFQKRVESIFSLDHE